MTIERGSVQERGVSQKGKPKIKINGEWYSAGRCDVSAVQVGSSVEFEWSEFGEPRNGKRPRGLDNWAFVNAPAANGHASAAPAPCGLDDQDRPFISNTVAHAIAAGLIKDATELEKWAIAAQCAIKACKGEKAQPQMPKQTFAGDMPSQFYGDEPPPEEPPPRSGRTW